MGLDIENIFTTSFKESLTQKGLIAASLYSILQIANFIFTQSLNPSSFSQYAFIENTALAGGLELVTIILLTVLNIGLLRAFVKKENLSRKLFTENILSASLNTILGGILFGLAVGIGFLLLFVPGIFLLVSLLFWTIYVAVENQNFIEGMKSSWNLTKGNRIDLFLLGFFLVFTMMIASFIVNIVITLAVSSLAGIIVYYIMLGYFTVVNIIAMSRTYNSLKQ